MLFAMPSRRSSALIFVAIYPNLVLEITDNGSGIADSQAASREGWGFSNLRARAENIGYDSDEVTGDGNLSVAAE